IIKTIGEQIGLESFVEMGTFAMDNKVMGGAIGVAIAYGLKAPPLVIFAVLFAGAFGAELGGPAGSYVEALVATEFGKLLFGVTGVDIIVNQLITILVGFFTSKIVVIRINQFMTCVGGIIN